MPDLKGILEKTKQCKSSLRISGWNAAQIDRYFVVSKHYSFSLTYLCGCSSDGFRVIESTIIVEMTRGTLILKTRKEHSKCDLWLRQSGNQRSRKILKLYSRLLKMKTPVSPQTFALKSWPPKEWFYTSSYPETSLTMLSPKHCGTVKAGGVSFRPPSLLSQTPSDAQTWQRTTAGRMARGKFFSPSLVIMILGS